MQIPSLHLYNPPFLKKVNYRIVVGWPNEKEKKGRKIEKPITMRKDLMVMDWKDKWSKKGSRKQNQEKYIKNRERKGIMEQWRAH